MKKVTALLIVLFVAASLFAATGLTVKAGGAFDLFFLRTDVSSGDYPHRDTYKGNGFGFDLGVQYDIGKNFMVYADYNMVFPYDFTMVRAYKSGEDDEVASFREYLSELENEFKEDFSDVKAKGSVFVLDASFGAAYKFDLGPVKLAVGGGAFCSLLRGSIGVTGVSKESGDKYDANVIVTFFNVGVSTLIDAKYMVAENIGINLTVMPQLGIYADRTINFYLNGEKDEDKTVRLNGVGISFVMPVTIGASYAF